MADLLHYPPFPDRQSLYDQLFRTVWHFLPMIDLIDKAIFLYAGTDFDELDIDSVLRNPSSAISADFDPAICDLSAKFVGKIEVISGAEVPTGLSDLKGVLVWSTADSTTVRRAQSVAQQAQAEVVLVDPNLVQQETLETIRFAYSLWPQSDLEQLVESSYAAFSQFIQRWRGKSIAVFGNGPSLGMVVQNKLGVDSDVRAVCNSTIGDDGALEYLKPELLFCGDPVQHCGVSLYAGEFRKGLSRALENEARVLFTQLGYVPYFRAVTPEKCHSRIIGIGNDRRSEFNIDLTKEYLTAATANIFTMLVLPVAFTISNEVDIFGCDGMSFSEATKPWSHTDEGDYMSRMSVTHRVHRGFWQRNYEEEYWSYSRDLSEILTTAEEGGIKTQVRTPSFVPALAKRFVPLEH